MGWGEMGLSLTILGCSGSYAEPGGACSGYLVRDSETSLWLDCGPGTLGNLQRHVSLADLTAIVVSHHHPDHFGELPVAYNAVKWYLDRETIPVIAPRSVREMADAMVGHDTSDVFDWEIVDSGDEVRIGGLDLRFDLTEHSVECMAVEIGSGDEHIVYTADTSPGWDLEGFAAGADLLLGEASILEVQEREGMPHLSSRQLAERARSAGVGRLVITHVIPGNDPEAHLREAATIYDGPIDIAEVGLTFEV